MYYCEDCRKERGWPVSAQPQQANICEVCELQKMCWDVSAAAIPLPGESIASPDNPFITGGMDPRAQALQDARDQMASGQAAATSLPPNYEELKQLVKQMANDGFSPWQVADAVFRPHHYWEYYRQKGQA